MADWLKVFQIDQTVVSSEVGGGWERMGEDGRMEVDEMNMSQHSYGIVVLFFSKKSLPKGRRLDSATHLVGT